MTEEFKELYEKQWTLGQLIDALKECDQDKNVTFPWGWKNPTTFNSYRGYYDEIALGYEKKDITVKQLLKQCEQALNCEYSGWKGGEYTYDRSTPVWIDNYGDGCGTILIGLIDVGYKIVLATGYKN